MTPRNKFYTFLDHVKWFGFRKLYWMILRSYWFIEDYCIDLPIFSTKKRQSLIKRRISRTLIETYSADLGQNINGTQYALGFGLIHYAFVRNLRPQRILCIGSRKGFVPAILALACKDNATGHVDFVDAGYGPETPDKHWSGVGFWKQVDPEQHFSNIHVSQYISTYVMTTRAFAQRHPDRRYQYIYIDGDHSYRGVKLDYALFWPKLEKHGFMVFHDVVVKGYLDKGLFGVWKFWKELGKKQTIVFPFPKDSGLGIIQK